MFFESPENIDFVGYADDNTPYTYSSKIEHVLTNLQGASEKLFSWFSANHLVANAGKCHFLTSSSLPLDIRITNTKISNVERVKLLGVNFEGRFVCLSGCAKQKLKPSDTANASRLLKWL